ncbi:methionine synthase [Bacillus sp. E214]|uniref:methionine synthase n=1 Tax=Bacillus sp. E214 TaxID=2587156 RepID=UPI0011DF0E33|nr:methionine synthase [Bacillus sp. E214]
MRTEKLKELLAERIVILDGAMGTMIQAHQLIEDDFGGEQYDGCNEYLTLTRPDVIQSIHEEYLAAGADIIETNTFGATPIVLDEYNLGHLAYQLNKESAQLARKATEQFDSPDSPRFVAGSMGPTTKTLSVTGGATFEQLADSYEEQTKGLLDGGVDLLLLETSQDLLNVKAAYIGMKRAFSSLGREVPLIISGTIEPMGTTLAGQTIEAFYISCEHMNPLAIGLNCATGPEFMADHIRSLSELSTAAVSCYPNAGLPDENGQYNESPSSLSKKIKQFAEKGWINLVGGCCGTTPDHIRAIKEAVTGIEARQINGKQGNHAVSGIDALIYDDSMRPLFVGERTNVIGSRKFKNLIKDRKFEEASEIARQQVKKGAHVIDVCLADPDSDEVSDMEEFMKEAAKKIKVPFVIDSTDEMVIEKALRHSQGKAIINSINLEDGEERFEKIVPLAKEYGAALVVGTIDEKGMAVTEERKLEVAQRSYQLLTEKYGIVPEDIIFDPLVFPVGTGDEQYREGAAETVKGLAAIKKELPRTLTILGISNVSFGLPNEGREVLNAVYLYHCTKAGLDYAIVNTEKLTRFALIPEEEVKLSENLLFHNSEESLAEFVAFYRTKKPVQKETKEKLPLLERLPEYIIEGTKDGLKEDIDEALEKGMEPLDIINGPLMAGMSKVGELFNDNQLIVAEVLQSAEAMKAAVSQLEPLMTKSGTTSTKGKMVLATVKGDVHDIGKNLVDIIMSNNGYEVVDLGIKVAPQTLIESVRNENPTIIGLSGLLVKSAQQMVITAQDLREAEIDVPIVVGGAALTRKFTRGRIAPEYNGPVFYAKDAMNGLDLINQLHDDEKRLSFLAQLEAETNEQAAVISIETKRDIQVTENRDKTVKDQENIPVPEDLNRHILQDYPLSLVYPYVNKQMLFGHHLGMKGKVDRLFEEENPKLLELAAIVDEILENNQIKLSAMYQYFPAKSDGEILKICSPANPDEVLETFDFPRQSKKPYLCLSDYVKDQESGVQDYVGLMIVTAGKGIKEIAEGWKKEGQYLKSHVIQSLALECAEGLAERVHHLMRDAWGIHDSIDMTMKERLSAKYTGQRYSFGYPACPNLEDQEKLFRLLKPEDIGIQLTEGFMMNPEASVSAMVFSHPEARYFNVGREE